MANILEVAGIGVFVMLMTAPILASSTTGTGIFSIMDDSYIQNVSELPYSAGTPEKNIQSSEHIRGWIDIVGFRDVARMDGVDYINGSPADKAIIAAGTGYYLSSNIVPGYSGSACYWCFFDSITDTVTVEQQGNKTAAILYITLKWHETVEGSGSSQTFYYTEHATFYDYEPAPIKIENNNIDIKVIVRERNFSVINTTEISIEIDDTVYDRYLIKTDYGFFEKINRIWHVEKTTKGIYYGNETKLDIFKSGNISHSQNVIIVNNNNTNFSITATGFYDSTSKTNITKVYESSDPVEQFLCGDLLGFLAVLLCFYGFYFYTLRRIT